VTAPRFVADENLNERLVLALVRRVPGVDIVRVRDVGRTGRTDADLLEWAATQDRVVITHDLRTMPRAAYARVVADGPMPGVLVVPDDAAPQSVIDDLALIAEVGTPDEWRDRVVFLPLRD
jgi:uncharacterized protein with PIN domain